MRVVVSMNGHWNKQDCLEAYLRVSHQWNTGKGRLTTEQALRTLRNVLDHSKVGSKVYRDASALLDDIILRPDPEVRSA